MDSIQEYLYLSEINLAYTVWQNTSRKFDKKLSRSTHKLMPKHIVLIFLTLLLLVGCQPEPEESTIIVSLVADGRERTFGYATNVTVEEFLADAEVELGDSDRLSHPLFTQITDGMKITVRRVTETQECQQETLPFERRLVPNEGIQSGAEQLAQSGQNGVQEVCYRVIFEDGVEAERIPNSQPTIITQPIDEIIYIGPSNDVEPLAIVGTLSYINNSNAWVIKGNTTNKRPLTTTSNLDSLVFDVVEDGSTLIYSTEVNDTDDFFNELWMIQTLDNSTPIKLTPTDVLYAEWRPATTDTIAYSTGEVRPTTPPWRALNNLWLMELDLNSGRALDIEEIIPESSGGLGGWWGTDYKWSPQGDKMAWTSADAMGIVDFATNELRTLVEFAVFNTSQSWAWVSPVSWSFDNTLIASTVHGAPLGRERAETSPVFDVNITSSDGSFSTQVKGSVGMWSAPKFSPEVSIPNSEYPEGFIAYLKAREPYNSINGEYDLVIADRDGSNEQIIFPSDSQAGIKTSDFGLSAKDFAWSPDSRFIAVVYQGDLWLVDVQSAVSYQVTFDGGSSNPVWTR